jgi:hypothetical protein
MIRAMASVVLVVGCALGVGACADGGDGDNANGGTIELVAGEAVSAELMLYVSNQSFADSTVTIAVTVDGQPIIDDKFSVGSQHNWVPFLIRLAPGQHTLATVSSTGATHSTVFEVSEVAMRYAVLNYWYYPPSGNGSDSTPRSFTFEIGDDPIGFA